MAQITIEGIPELLRTLDFAASMDILEIPMRRSVLYLEAPMKLYPPQPVGSLYRRRGASGYGGRWTTAFERSSSMMKATIGNNLRDKRGRPVAPWIGSEQFQTRVHQRTGWPTDQGVAEAQLPTIIEEFEASIAVALRRGPT